MMKITSMQRESFNWKLNNKKKLTSLEPLPRTVDRGRVLVSCSSCSVCINVIMVWQVKQHHASHYVTSADCHSCCFDGCSDRDYCYDCGFDVGALVIAALCYYRARALRTNVERIIYIPQLANASPLSMKCYICREKAIVIIDQLKSELFFNEREREELFNSPVLVLTDWSWSENRSVWLARQHQVLFAFAELVLSIAAVVAKVLRMNLANDERMAWSTVLHDVTLGRVELHRFLEPNNLRARRVNWFLCRLRFMSQTKCDDDETLSHDKFFNTPFAPSLNLLPLPPLNIKWLIVHEKKVIKVLALLFATQMLLRDGETMKGRKSYEFSLFCCFAEKHFSNSCEQFYYKVNHLLLERINNFSLTFLLFDKKKTLSRRTLLAIV